MRLLFVVLLVLSPVIAVADMIKHQGTDRWYHVFNPGLSAGEAAPLVVVLHGYASPESAVAARTDPKRLDWPEVERMAWINRFRLLMPLAWEGRWSLFDGISKAVLDDGTPVDDVGFVHQLVDKLVQSGLADPARIYLTGYSDGGIMTFRLLCAPDSPFAAGAPVMAFMREENKDDCRPDRPPPILVIAGTEDPILPYDGRLFATGRYVSVPEAMELWRKRYGCTGQTWEFLEDRAPDDQSRIRQVDWTGCSLDGAIRLYRVEGSGHLPPSFSPPTSEWAKTKAGPRNRDIETANHVWDFFQQFQRIE